MRTGPENILRLIAFGMGAIVIAMAAIELRDALDEDAARGLTEVADDPLRITLRRCRTLTPERLETDNECQTAWAENRRRFFGTNPNREGVE
ncbi:MAG: putative entry exclusion protein TrbK-alt [Pseudomonadota bacterium]